MTSKSKYAHVRVKNFHITHPDIICNNCDAKPIMGIRYKCLNCKNYDLCSICEVIFMRRYDVHDPTHIFAKIVNPIDDNDDKIKLSNINEEAPMEIDKTKDGDAIRLKSDFNHIDKHIVCTECENEIYVCIPGTCTECKNSTEFNNVKYCDDCSVKLCVCYSCGKDAKL